tara:strand:+ start:31 stop:249 length:219 start_codon:yes stop_codon:yes gene_type:complete
MNLNEFIAEFTEFAELEENYPGNENLSDFDEWDSMTAMMLIGFCSERLKKNITGEDLENLKTYEEIFNHVNN